MLRWERVLVLSGAASAVIAGLAVAAVLAGAALPAEHEVSAARAIGAPCAVIWCVLTDYEEQPAWREELVQVSRMPHRLGHPAWLEYYRHGERMLVSELRAEPPGLIALELEDQTGPYRGRWSFALEDRDGACEVQLVERAGSSNPMFRFAWHYLVGEGRYARRFLDQLAARAVGQAATRRCTQRRP